MSRGTIGKLVWHGTEVPIPEGSDVVMRGDVEEVAPTLAPDGSLYRAYRKTGRTRIEITLPEEEKPV